MSSRPFSFNIAPTDGSKPSPFSPSPAKTGGGLFSTGPFDSSPETSPEPSHGRSLFAGATPAKGAKPFGNGNGGIFGASGKPKAQFAPPSFGGFNPGSSMMSSPGSQTAEESFMSSAYEEDDTPQIYEDDSRGEPTMQDDEDDDTGVYGDEEDYDDSAMDGTLQGDSDSMDGSGRKFQYVEGITGPITEPGDLVMKTEELLQNISTDLMPRSKEEDEYEDDEDVDMDRPAAPTLEMKQQTLSKNSKLFLGLLQETIALKSKPLLNAYRVLALVLPLHHSTANTAEVLRKWLHIYAPRPSNHDLKTFKAFFPNHVLNPQLWDTLHRLILRGEVHEALEILQTAKWELLSQEANKAPADKQYTREEIMVIREAVGVTEKLLRTMPGRGRSSYQPSTTSFPSPNPILDSPGTPADWRIWRGQVVKAHEELRGISTEASDAGFETDESYYGPANGAGGGYGFGYGVGSRAATRGAKCPTDVIRGLRNIYEVMSGERDAIIAAADEWYEAVVSLFVWTREVVEVTQEEEDEEENLDGLEALLFEHRKRRELYRLREIVEGINDEHPMDQTSSIQIMLGGAMASDPSLCVELSDHSVLAAAALVEIGSATGWIPRETTAQASKAGSLLMDDFNADDMEVLGMDRGSPDPAASDAEDILRTYASALFGTEWIDEAAQIEGWEFGVGVLSRVKDGKLLTSKLLSDIPLTSAERVDKLLQHCTDTSLPTTASSIAYSWATKLQQTTPNAHGNILQYLALAPDHPSARADMHKLLTSLITTTLRSGTPPTADDTLAELLTTPSAVRSDLLRFELAGYAALRHYYEIRTADPAAATQALVAVIRSAGEGVDGGVWDRAWEAPVEPAVLPLLWRELLGCWQWMGVREALDVAKGVTDWEAADGEVKAESDKVWREAKEEWVDVKEEKVQDVLRRVRLGIAKVLADRWVMGEE